MEDSTRLTETNEHRRHRSGHRDDRTEYSNRQQQQQQQEKNKQQQQSRRDTRDGSGHRVDLIDDECSTDSGCSSGGSTGSAERLSRRGSAERLCRVSRSHHCYHDRIRGRPTTSQERLSSVQRSSERTRASSYSPSLSDAHSSCDSDSLKRPSTAALLRRTLQALKIPSKMDSKDKKHAKKSPNRILRSPNTYTYVTGLSGIPTRRVPRNTVQQFMTPCCGPDSIGLYR